MILQHSTTPNETKHYTNLISQLISTRSRPEFWSMQWQIPAFTN